MQPANMISSFAHRADAAVQNYLRALTQTVSGVQYAHSLHSDCVTGLGMAVRSHTQ
jgi:hypothetical protein